MVKRILCILGMLSFVNNAQAYWKAYCEEFYLPIFYIGADAQLRRLPFAKDFGGNVFKKNYPQANFYLGLKGNEFIGIEAGYEFSRSRSRKASLPANSILFGIPLNANAQLNNITRLKGLHASVVGYFPFPECENLRFIAGLGILNMKIKLESVLMQLGRFHNVPAYGGRPLRLSESKYIMRLMGGVQYMFTEYFGIRANIRWENTRKFKNILPVKNPSPEICRAKDSVVIGLGGVVEF